MILKFTKHILGDDQSKNLNMVMNVTDDSKFAYSIGIYPKIPTDVQEKGQDAIVAYLYSAFERIAEPDWRVEIEIGRNYETE
jgi:hypothetical protein